MAVEPSTALPDQRASAGAAAGTAAAAAAVRDTPLVFSCQGETLLGVVSHPTAVPPRRTAVLVVVGGPQYRAGSHRLFIRLARGLADAGHACMRFDVRGMGDSSGAARSFDDIGDDIGAAIDTLMAHAPGTERVVLWGLCDGASAALLYTEQRHDPRVGGLVLLNPWVRSAASLARTRLQRYYPQRLLAPSFWRKLLRGDVGLDALREWLDKRRLAQGEPPRSIDTYQHRMARAWQGFGQPMLLVLADEDETAFEFLSHAGADPAWQGSLANAGLTRCHLACADHTFSAAEHGQRVIDETIAWLAGLNSHASPTAAAGTN